MISRAMVVTAAMLLLVACSGGGTPSATPSPSHSAAVTPSASASTSLTPSPTPEETSGTPGATVDPASALDCPSSWDDGLHEDGPATLDLNRYADICVGESFDNASAVPGAQQLTGEPMCPWVGPIVEAGDLYIAAISGPDDPGERIEFFRAVWMGDIASISPAEMPATAEGITLGSTVAEVYAAYPDAFELTLDDPARGPRTEIVVPGPASLGYVFDTTDGRVSEITWGIGMDDGVAGEFCAL